MNIEINTDLPSAVRKLNESAAACTGPSAVQNAIQLSGEMTRIYQANRDGIVSTVQNTAGATNTVDSGLKRVAILNESVRDFAKRVLPLRAFATSFLNVPLQGTDEAEVPYYTLQTAASSNFVDGAGGDGSTGYIFGQSTNTGAKKITLNKRKYQPIDFSSNEFRRQPFFNLARLAAINAEKLGVDVVTDVLSAITNAKYGAAALTAAAAAVTSDDIVTLRGACNTASWPDTGRSLIANEDLDTALQKDPSYKLALNIGTTSVIQRGEMPNLSGFTYYHTPTLPDNSEKLIGCVVFPSALGFATAPIDPAPGVRQQLVSYLIATDEMTGVSFNYRHWGLAQADRDYQVIEVAYGYEALLAAALKRICAP